MREIYIEYGEEIFRFLRRMVGSVEDAEDILEETFITLLGTEEVSEKTLRQFLYKIAYSRAVDFLRKKKREKDFFDGYEYFQKEEKFDPLEIEEALLCLNEKERVAILLFFEDGYRYKEISKIMDISIGTVKTLIHRGKEKLKSYFKGDRKNG